MANAFIGTNVNVGLGVWHVIGAKNQDIWGKSVLEGNIAMRLERMDACD